MKNIFILAAENSAEKYGSMLIKKFRDKRGNFHFFGAGGDKFRNLGVEILVHSKELSIVGIVEIFVHLFRLRMYMHLFLKTAKKKRCDAAILIDYPDFNLRLARKLKKTGIPVYFYISPTVWAWRYSRVKKIKKCVDHLFIIFPFEKDIYRKERIPFTYTGHPLIKLIKSSENLKSFRERNQMNGSKKILTLLPGSRKSEISSLLPVMLDSVGILSEKYDLKLFILKADSIEMGFLNGFLENFEYDISIISQPEGYDLISVSDAVLSTCGTSNLETAVLGTPFVAVYKVNGLSYFLGKGLLKISNYSIVNILLKKRLIDELIQGNFTKEKVSGAVEDILVNEKKILKIKREFVKLKKLLELDKDPSELIVEKIIADID